MTLKSLLPFENYTLTTSLSVDEVLNRLAKNIGYEQGFSFSAIARNLDKPYTGEIIGKTFTMSRNISYKNSFLPVITGQISAQHGQTQINIKMQPATFILVFTSIWLGAVALICISILMDMLSEFDKILQNGLSPVSLIPFGMLILFCLVIHFAFKMESKISKNFLAGLLEGVET